MISTAHSQTDERAWILISAALEIFKRDPKVGAVNLSNAYIRRSYEKNDRVSDDQKFINNGVALSSAGRVGYLSSGRLFAYVIGREDIKQDPGLAAGLMIVQYEEFVSEHGDELNVPKGRIYDTFKASSRHNLKRVAVVY